jgi:hypothetical protein
MRTKGSLSKSDRRNTTGCVGVSFRFGPNRRGGKPRRWFYARGPGFTRQFCADTLGVREAFRRAVAARAAFIEGIVRP